jgi:hypothetical protein
MAKQELLGQFGRNSGQTLELFYAEDVKGAVLVVDNAAMRDAIPTAGLRNKQLCLLGDTGLWYQWSGASWGAYTGFGGSGGISGIPMTFFASTVDGDPGAGGIRLNHATPASATQLYIDDVEASDGTNIRDLIAALGNVIGAQVRLQSKSADENWIVYKVGGYTSATGYGKLTGLTVVDSSATVTLSTTAGDTILSIDVGVPKDLGNQSLVGIKSTSFSGEVDNATNAIDWTTGSLQRKLALASSPTLTFTAPPAFTAVQFRWTQDGTGGRVITWPGTVLWAGGIEPNWDLSPNAENVAGGYYDGTNYRLGAESDGAMRVVTESTTTRTMVLADGGAMIECTNAGGCAITVPPHASVPIRVGKTTLATQSAAGQITLVAGAGVTLETSETLKTLKQYSVIGWTKLATNRWRVFGERELA